MQKRERQELQSRREQQEGSRLSHLGGGEPAPPADHERDSGHSGDLERHKHRDREELRLQVGEQHAEAESLRLEHVPVKDVSVGEKHRQRNEDQGEREEPAADRKSTRLNSSHQIISY